MKTKKWKKIVSWSFVVSMLIVLASCSSQDDYIYIIEKDSNPPVADFSYSVEGLTVSFTNKSEDATNYSWDFDDASTGTEVTGFNHVYGAKGNYTVTLTAKDGNGLISTHTEEITVGYPVAGFTYAVNKKVVTFTNTSANASSYSWDFGDGSTSNEENPVHTFPVGGVEYTVSLTAIDGTDEDIYTFNVMTLAKLEVVIIDWDHNVDTDGWATVNCSFANSGDSYDFDDSYGKSSKIDDDDKASGNGDMIYQVVSISPDEDYNFSFWVYQKHAGGTDGEQGAVVGTIETVVNGGADRGTVLGTVTTTATGTKIWNNFNGDFNTGSNSEVVIRLYYDYDVRAAGQVEARVDYVEIK